MDNNHQTAVPSDAIIDSLSDGLYVCDRERRILFWNKAAQRITGWSADEVVGHRCMDNILCHTDKDERTLCGEALCPLHRAMVTDRAATFPVIVFGKTKEGGRIPLEVAVAPLHDHSGEVVGGVETFRDFSAAYQNQERARRIQTLSLEHDLSPDRRVSFDMVYLPHDMIGGDFYAIRQLDAHRYGFFLADVMGHGEAAALHTMHLSSLWNRYCWMLRHPARFARMLNKELCRIVRDESFATGICGVLDAEAKRVRIASAGGPPPVVMRASGEAREAASEGFPFGMMEDAQYEESELSCASGDTLLLFTDGAFEVHNAAGEMLGSTGLVRILRSLGHPAHPLSATALQRELILYSNEIRLKDDLTLIEVRFS